MKILITGMSSRAVGSTRLRIKYVTFASLLGPALRELGHEVEQRKVSYGEDLSGFDRAFVHVNPPDKIVTVNIPEVCRALLDLGPRAILFCDDWVVNEMAQATNHVLTRRWEGWLSWKGYHDLSEDKKVEMQKVLGDIIHGCPWPVIAPFFGGAPAPDFFTRNFKTDRWVALDPSGMVEVPEFKPGIKRREWVLATLQKHDDWVGRQGFTWPVLKCGNKRWGQEVLTEAQVVNSYAQAWGVLAPRYPVAGWWRTRFLFAAATGSVLYCDPSDGLLLGSTYQAPLKSIEAYDREQLELMAKAQGPQLSTALWSKTRFLSELAKLLPQ